MLYKSSKNIIAILTIIVFALAGCGDDDSSASLDGDLSFRITGESDIPFFVSGAGFSENGASQSGNTVFPPFPKDSDLDNGDFEGYRLTASPQGTGSSDPDITLILLSDGDVIEETSNPDDNGTYGIEVGDVPDFSNFN